MALMWLGTSMKNFPWSYKSIHLLDWNLGLHPLVKTWLLSQQRLARITPASDTHEEPVVLQAVLYHPWFLSCGPTSLIFSFMLKPQRFLLDESRCRTRMQWGVWPLNLIICRNHVLLWLHNSRQSHKPPPHAATPAADWTSECRRPSNSSGHPSCQPTWKE